MTEINSISSWISGLMAENSNSVGFIPNTTIAHRYIANNQYILQLDERGKRIGYILYGKLQYGKPVVISQHCIQYEKRLQGYGRLTFLELLRRAEKIGVSSIILRCAENLPALQFWQSVGFQILSVESPNNARNRLIIKMTFPLMLPLFNFKS
jgi:GNAT superfamily N-acetyltransferase